MDNRLVDAKAFYLVVVEPDVRDFFNRPGSTRNFVHCALSLYHLADWIFIHHKDSERINRYRDETAYTEALIEKCPEFKTILSVANATKHAERNKRARHVIVTRPDQAVPNYSFSSMLATDPLTTAPIATAGGGGIIVNRDDGSKISAWTLVNKVHVMWREEGQVLGWFE